MCPAIHIWHFLRGNHHQMGREDIDENEVFGVPPLQIRLPVCFANFPFLSEAQDSPHRCLLPPQWWWGRTDFWPS